MIKAKDLIIGDVVGMRIYGKVIAVEPVADGKRIKVRLALENQVSNSVYRDLDDDKDGTAIEGETE